MSVPHCQCTSSTELSRPVQMNMDLRMTQEGGETQQAPLLSILSCLSSHGPPSNHPALIHDSSSSRCFCALCPPVPPFSLLSSTVWASGLIHSLLPLHLMYYWRTQQAEWTRERRKERENQQMEQCTGGECVRGDWIKLCSPFHPEHQSLFIRPCLGVLHL